MGAAASPPGPEVGGKDVVRVADGLSLYSDNCARRPPKVPIYLANAIRCVCVRARVRACRVCVYFF